MLERSRPPGDAMTSDDTEAIQGRKSVRMIQVLV